MAEELFEVECILDMQGKGRKKQYLVRWKNYGPEVDSWVPESSMKLAKGAIKKFLEMQKSGTTNWGGKTAKRLKKQQKNESAMEEKEENGLINFIAHLVEFKWNAPQDIEMIDKNFPYFHSTNPELIIKLSALNFLNKCADEIAGKGEGKYQKLLEIGKKTKEMLEEIRENMEAKKFGKLSNEIESALSHLFANSIEEVNSHPIRQNRRQIAETVKVALMKEVGNE